MYQSAAPANEQSNPSDSGMVVADSLPDEVKELIEVMKLDRETRIAALGMIVSEKRKEAVDGRRESGIEKIWDEDEEFYHGIDDVNRGTNAWTKSPGIQGGLQANTDKDNKPTRCKAFFNITRQFCDSASSRMGDILLPAGDWNFGIKATPIPDFGANQITSAVQGTLPQQPPQLSLVPNQPQGAIPVQQNQLDQQTQTQDQADTIAEKAETRIRDWLTDSSLHSEERKTIDSAVQMGTGILKGPYPSMMKAREIVNNKLVIEEKIVPKSSFVNPRNFFPDPNCGDNIHNGEYCLERELFSARQLRDLKELPGYIAENIDKVLAEGAGKRNYDKASQTRTPTEITSNDDRYEIWYFYGLVDIKQIEATKEFIPASLSSDTKELVPAIVTLVNDTAIRATLNPLDSGEFPYDLMVWQPMMDMPWGIGVSRQGRTAQEMFNASARALMDNAGLGSGPMWVVDQSKIEPIDGKWELMPRKGFRTRRGEEIVDVRNAIQFFSVPMIQNELNAIMTVAQKMFEDSTGISFLLMGQQGSAPDTVGGMELLHRNASALLRRCARIFDERITEPHIRRYYDWLLMYGEDDEKGDLQIEAYGSTALVEREIYSMDTMQQLQLAANPAYGIDPKKAYAEYLRSKRLTPSKFQYSETDMVQVQQAMAQRLPPQAMAAKIRADASIAIAQEKDKTDVAIAIHRDQVEQARVQNEQNTNAANIQAIAQRDQMDFQEKLNELQVKKELALMDYALQHKMKLEDVRSELAITAAKLQTQKELSIAALTHGKHAVQNVITPPTEPVLHAPAGQAWEE